MTPLQTFIHKRPHLVWYVADRSSLDDASVVEHTLNYGSWDDVQTLFREYGIDTTAAVFRAHTQQSRSNYRKPIRTYFTKYFEKHAH